MKLTTYAGLGTALITPFKDGLIDFESYEGLIEKQIEAGVNYVVVAGSTGEISTITEEEFSQLVKCAIKCANGRIPVIVNCNNSSTAKAVEIIKLIDLLGADGIMCTTPAYNKPTQQGLIAHYTALAAATKLPIVVYNAPGRTAVDLSNDTIVKLAQIPNIIGLKDASSDVTKPLHLVSKLPKDFTMVTGNDDMLIAFCACGGRGDISVASNVVPKFYVELVDKCLKGQFVEALAMHQKINELVKALSMEPNPIPIKYAVSLQGLCSAEMRLPLCEPSDACKEAIKKALDVVNLQSSSSSCSHPGPVVVIPDLIRDPVLK